MRELQKALDRICDERRIPGAVVGVVSDGETAVATHGIGNLNTGIPVVRETLFQAGSIGKSYTATAVMQLVDDGSLSLDAPLRDYIPDLEFADAGVSKTLTARQILTHTAGIDGDRLDQEFAYGRGDDCVARYVAGLTDLPLITAPGGLWSYCNSGYVVLGRLIEVLTDLPFETALRTRLLEPAGLTDTLFFPGEMVMRSLAVGHVRQGDSDPIVAPMWEMSRAAGPAGSTINATIDDLLGFAQIHLNDGIAPNGERVLSEASARAMREPLVACPEHELLGDHWGLGFFVRTLGGPLVYGHDGNTIGLTACLRIIPDKKAAWGLLMNLSSQNWAAADFAQAAIDPWLGTVTLGGPAPSGAAPDAPGRYVGTYTSIGAKFAVTEDDGGLAATLEPLAEEPTGPPMTGTLQYVAGDRFVLQVAALGDDVMPVTFLEPNNGGFDYLHMGARLYRRA